MQDSVRAAAISGPPPAPQTEAPSFWYELIGEESAAKFVDLSVRSIQGYRYKGGGPKFIRLSARCVKYRRCDLREWVEARIRISTSDTGQAAS